MGIEGGKESLAQLSSNQLNQRRSPLATAFSSENPEAAPIGAPIYKKSELIKTAGRG